MTREARGPYFDELEVGQVFDDAPGYTLTEGRAAAHQSIVGDRLRLALDAPLSAAVTGDGVLAHPAFVWDVAIGQSTVVTHHVKANLFYRHLVLLRQPRIGDTLSTTTTVVALKENRRREGRRPTGLAALRMQAYDQDGRAVLDFYRCAMLPLAGEALTGRDDDLEAVGADRAAVDPATSVRAWDLDAWRRVAGTQRPSAGDQIEVVGADVVSSAPELARLTLNVAQVHHDARAAGGRRLVYGGHTIGVAAAQVARALPQVVTVVAWHACDHVGPVHEGDALRSVITVERVEEVEGGGALAHLRVGVTADADDGGDPRPVLDWRPVVLLG